MLTIIPTKELNFIVNDFLYMYYLISKYVVVGGGGAFGNKLLRKFNS